MTRFLMWLLAVMLVGGALASVPYVLPRGAATLAKVSPAAGTPYDIFPLDEARSVARPALPDISRETVDSVRAFMPALTEGDVAVRSMEKMRLHAQHNVHLFAEWQNRFDPLMIVIESGVYDLAMLQARVNDPALLSHDGQGTYHLYVPLVVESGAGLVMGDNAHLRMGRNGGALIANFGRLDVVGARIEGWDLEAHAPAPFTGKHDFRPYIASLCGSEMNLAGAHFAHLGYFDVKAYGITYTSCNGRVYKTADHSGARGRVIGNRFDDIYYGFYSYESSHIKVIGNEYVDNIMYGIDPHDRSKHLIIARNTVRGTKLRHGIITSRDVSESFIFDNISEYNERAGMLLDRASVNNVIVGNILRHNRGDGMAFYESGHNVSYGNVMTDNGGYGMRIRNSAGIVSRHDVINKNAKGALQAYTVDLTSVGADRDFTIDPYERVTSADMAQAEMISNGKVDITLRDVEEVRLFELKRYQAPEKFMTGDLEMHANDMGNLVIRRKD